MDKLKIGQVIYLTTRETEKDETVNLYEYRVVDISDISIIVKSMDSNYHIVLDVTSLFARDITGRLHQGYIYEKEYWDKVGIINERAELLATAKENLEKLSLENLREIEKMIEECL